MRNRVVAFVVASLLFVNGQELMASIQLNIGDVVTATLTQSASIMGTGATSLSLYNNSLNQILETWNSSQGGLLGWTNVKVNGQAAPNFNTSCIEVLQNVSWGSPATWTIADLASAPTPNALNGLAGGMGNAAANLIQALFDAHYQDAKAGNTNAGAFQIAIWKLEYDGPNVVNSPNFTSGRLRASATTEISLATQWLTNLSGNSHSETVALTSDTFQDQVYGSPTPEPASCMVWATLASIGLGGALVKRQR